MILRFCYVCRGTQIETDDRLFGFRSHVTPSGLWVSMRRLQRMLSRRQCEIGDHGWSHFTPIRRPCWIAIIFIGDHGEFRLYSNCAVVLWDRSLCSDDILAHREFSLLSNCVVLWDRSISSGDILAFMGCMYSIQHREITRSFVSFRIALFCGIEAYAQIVS